MATSPTSIDSLIIAGVELPQEMILKANYTNARLGAWQVFVRNTGKYEEFNNLIRRKTERGKRVSFEVGDKGCQGTVEYKRSFIPFKARSTTSIRLTITPAERFAGERIIDGVRGAGRAQVRGAGRPAVSRPTHLPPQHVHLPHQHATGGSERDVLELLQEILEDQKEQSEILEDLKERL